jgi:diguanylate cyclase
MTQAVPGAAVEDVVGGRWWPLGAVGVATMVAVVFFSLSAGGLAQTTLFVLVAFAAPVLLAVRLAREQLLGSRLWVLLWLGAGLYALATPFWGLLPIVTGRELPFPSPLDAVYFASYTLSAAFLMSLLRHRHRRTEEAGRGAAVALLEAGIFAIALLAILWPGLISPNLTDPDIGPLAQSVAVGYPLLTAVLFGLVVRLAISARSWTAELSLLLLWAGGELAGDIFYGYLSASGDFSYGHPISVFWLLSYTALGTLALHPRLLRLTAADGQLALEHSSRLWFPLGAVLLPLAVSVFSDSLILELAAITGVLLLVARLHLMSGDLTEQRRLAVELATLSRQLEHTSLHDELTGLANRALFTEQLELAWAHHQRHRRGLSVLAIDLDGFKQVNDRYGHHAGDQLLIAAAQRMHRCVRDGDTLARLGGDEFAVILPDTGIEAACEVAARVRQELAAPLIIDDEPHTIAASIGIGPVHDRQPTPEMLLQEADTAMYAAKAAGKDTHAVYSPGLERATTVVLPEVAPTEAAAWADYVRGVRLEIAERKTTGDLAPTTRAPESVHRTLEQVLIAIDQLDTRATHATLVLPAQQDLEEFIFHHTGVQHWADALVERGLLTVTRPPPADRFWTYLAQQAAITPGP